MSTTTLPPVDEVRAAISAVPDPELPVVTIGMLGMVHDVRVDDDGVVSVELLPTFSGCPATDVIGEDVADAVRTIDGVTDVHVRFRFDPPWSATMIDEDGREALRRFGITPPGGAVDAPAPEGRPTLPLAAPTARPCPYCGSVDTARDSAFGPTPCRSIHYCNACRQPFEAFKDL